MLRTMLFEVKELKLKINTMILKINEIRINNFKYICSLLSIELVEDPLKFVEFELDEPFELAQLIRIILTQFIFIQHNSNNNEDLYNL
ncbi:hypothetical protein BLOT_016354 [Blomia tropicalis]|nr:hypothetical protein BLOT_016354 [Blomia tropicalis]